MSNCALLYNSMLYRPQTSCNIFTLFFISILCLFLTSCGNSDSSSSAAAGAANPFVATTNPLVAEYSISLTQEGSVYVEFGPDTNYGQRTSAQQIPPGGGTATILVAGMRQNKTYHMRAVVTDSNGTIHYRTDRTFTTGKIPPSRIPQTHVTIPVGMAPSPGVELAMLNPGNANQLMIVAFDPTGDVVWYYDYNASLGLPQAVKLLPNGHMLIELLSSSAADIREVDLAGNVVHDFTLSELNRSLTSAGYKLTVSTINHDILPLPNGHLLVLGTDDQLFTDLPGYPGTTDVLGNDIVDFDSNYKPVWIWKAFDHLDVNRHPVNFPDWTHANSLAYSPSDGDILFSLRHQSWVIKIDYNNGAGSGNVLWRLGYQGDFTLDTGAPANWFYGQHDVTIISSDGAGNIVLGMLDNGYGRVLDANGDVCGSAVTAACYSRPAIFEVNENNMTAHVMWSYDTVYSFWGGVTQLLPDENVFFDLTAPGDNPTGARVMEVTQEDSPEVVWQLDINGQNSYRTIHLPSLYPGVQW